MTSCFTEETARQFYLEQVEILWNCVEFVDFNPLWRDLFVDMLQHLKMAVLVCDRLFARVSELLSAEEKAALVAPLRRLFEYNIPDLAKVG